MANYPQVGGGVWIQVRETKPMWGAEERHGANLRETRSSLKKAGKTAGLDAPDRAYFPLFYLRGRPRERLTSNTCKQSLTPDVP